jgi:hypothetical protein
MGKIWGKKIYVRPIVDTQSHKKITLSIQKALVNPKGFAD